MWASAYLKIASAAQAAEAARVACLPRELLNSLPLSHKPPQPLSLLEQHTRESMNGLRVSGRRWFINKKANVDTGDINLIKPLLNRGGRNPIIWRALKQVPVLPKTRISTSVLSPLPGSLQAQSAKYSSVDSIGGDRLLKLERRSDD
jgi:hypothetical protein